MKYLLLDEKDGILTITLNRPQALNALNIPLLSELKKVFDDQVYPDKNIKGVIITGSGNKAFAAGADIAEFANFVGEEGEAMSRDGHRVFNTIEQSPKPVIAAINGFSLGGGNELAMACHLRIASSTARFGQPEVNLGLIPGYGATQRLPQLIGKGKAMELLMTADIIKADEALRLGLVNRVLEPEELMAACRAVLLKIMSKGPLAIARVIGCVNAFYEDAQDGFDEECRQFGVSFETRDFKEGTAAFLAKKPAKFTGE